MNTEKNTSNCYKIAASSVLYRHPDVSSSDCILVHGRPRLQVFPYSVYGHAWIGHEEQVIDLLGNFNGPRFLYHALGNIDWKACFVYTKKEVAAFLAQTKHWDPWEGPDAVSIDGCLKRWLPKRTLISRLPQLPMETN